MSENNNEDVTTVTVKLNQSQVNMLDRIVEHYRAPSRAHALRLAIEDKYKEIGELPSPSERGIYKEKG